MMFFPLVFIVVLWPTVSCYW